MLSLRLILIPSPILKSTVNLFAIIDKEKEEIRALKLIYYKYIKINFSSLNLKVNLYIIDSSFNIKREDHSNFIIIESQENKDYLVFYIKITHLISNHKEKMIIILVIN